MKPEGGGGLPSRVEQWFYKHGLFISSYPLCPTMVAALLLLFCSYPLLYVPLPGTIPTKIDFPYRTGGGGGAAEGGAAAAAGTSGEHRGGLSAAWNGTSDRASLFFGLASSHNLTTFEAPPPLPWAGRQEPFVYVQQILFRVSVIPWTDELIVTDAYRATFAEVFKLIEVVRNHQAVAEKQQRPRRASSAAPLTLSDICLHVENEKRGSAGGGVGDQQTPSTPPQQQQQKERLQQEKFFPEYNCLLLSPANFWQQNAAKFNRDATLLNTIYAQHNIQKTKISVAEMLLGMKIKDSGIKRYPLRARMRVVQFAVTLMLTENHEAFLESLREKLRSVYPLTRRLESEQPQEPLEYATWIYYPGRFNIMEFLPLFATLLSLSVYIYLSMRKMELLKLPIVLAIGAILTIVGSLVMSLGFCFFFGLTISNQLRGFLPYLVVLVGLENVLVISKCILSTDETLDVKIRVARGLSKEGWSIAKTLLTEITILTVGLATFVPFIQEFCIFLIVALISDFLLQMLLFSTILAMDIRPYNHHPPRGQWTMMGGRWRRLGAAAAVGGHGDDDSDDADEEGDVNERKTTTMVRHSAGGFVSASGVGAMARSQSHPKLSSMVDAKDVIATRPAGPGGVGGGMMMMRLKKQKRRTPKRLKIMNFWARTRFFQRCFMIWMCVWISMIVYQSGAFEKLFEVYLDVPPPTAAKGNSSEGAEVFGAKEGERSSQQQQQQHVVVDRGRAKDVQRTAPAAATVTSPPPLVEERFNYTDSLRRLRFAADSEPRDALSPFHWSAILKRYNISLTGRYITILPSIRVSHVVTPEEALKLRHPEEESPRANFQWKFPLLAAALDPIDFSNDGSQSAASVRRNFHRYPYGTPLYPKSPMELFFAAILVAISVFVLTYTMIVLYRCICTRNYAEWRASWTDQAVAEVPPGKRKLQSLLQNSVPISIRGHHLSTVECLASDGALVASSCLEGRINVWDVTSGMRICSIGRKEAQAEGEGGSGGEKKRRGRRKQIWCLDFVDNLVAVGCADGRLEFWEGSTGREKCTVESHVGGEGGEEEDQTRNGVTHIKLIGDQVIAARLCGRIDFLKLESYNHGKQIDWGFTSAYRRTHIRTGSTGSLGHFSQNASHNNNISHLNNSSNRSGPPGQGINGEELRCTIQAQHQGSHQKPVTCLEVTRNILFVGGQDHLLKVFRLDGQLAYTLHGHCGPISCLFIDQRDAPGSGGSGSQDGLLCLWELDSGACVYAIQAHDGAVLSLVASPSYLISLGGDERLCVWERFQGHLLNSVNISYAYSAMLMLTPSLLVTSKPGALLVWDVRTGEPVKEVRLDCANSQLSPKVILPAAADCVVCDFGNELRIVRFPLVAEKVD